jgi:hypothetical protein
MYKFRTHILIFINYIFLVLCPYIYHIFLSHKAKEKTNKYKKQSKKKETQKIKQKEKQRNTKTKKKEKKETQKTKQKEKTLSFIPGELYTKFARGKLTGGSQCLCIPDELYPKFARGKLHRPTCHMGAASRTCMTALCIWRTNFSKRKILGTRYMWSRCLPMWAL